MFVQQRSELRTILAFYTDTALTSRDLQTNLNKILVWLEKWRKSNKFKFLRVTCTLRGETRSGQYRQAENAKYIDLHLDR